MARWSMVELEAVVAVARRGGFRAAARELNISSSALSHAVAGLEERIGVRLFNRTTRSVALTAAGEQFLAEVAPALSAIDRAIAEVGEHQAAPTGTLRLNMALGAARLLLEPLILEYLRRYPLMQVEIVTEGAHAGVLETLRLVNGLGEGRGTGDDRALELQAEVGGFDIGAHALGLLGMFGEDSPAAGLGAKGAARRS